LSKPHGSFNFITENWEVEFSHLTNYSHLEESWSLLEEQADCDFFLSWDWICTWLNLHPSPEDLYLLSIKHHQEVICLGIFTERQLSRCKIFSYKSLLLHESGDQLDNITIEFNSLLIHSKHQKSITKLLKQVFSRLLEDRGLISFPGIKNKTIINSIPEDCIIHSADKPHYWVNLKDINASTDSYLSSLSKNTRSQITQSINKYKKNGPLKIQFAQNTDEAINYLDHLIELHQVYWQHKQKNSSFLEDSVIEFHKKLITRCFEKGSIILAHISAGETDLGYLYNFSYNKRIYAYQSGIELHQDNKYRPGLIAHTLLIEKLLNTEVEKYDFMAGEYRYKKSLSSHQENMKWLYMMKNTFINRTLNSLNCFFTKTTDLN